MRTLPTSKKGNGMGERFRFIKLQASFRKEMRVIDPCPDCGWGMDFHDDGECPSKEAMYGVYTERAKFSIKNHRQYYGRRRDRRKKE